MRNSARPVLLRSLNVIGGAIAASSAPGAAAPFGLCADDEILIQSMLPSGICSQSLSLITRTSVCFFTSLVVQYYANGGQPQGHLLVSAFSVWTLAGTPPETSEPSALPGRNSLQTAPAGTRRP